MKLKRKNIILLVILIAVIAIIATKCGGQPEVKGDQDEAIQKEVNVLEIAKTDTVDSKFSASGTASPVQHSIVRAMAPGTVEYLIPVGEMVNIGEPLFSLRDSNIETNYYNALSSFQQTQALTMQRVTQASLGLNSAQARYDMAQKSFDLTKTQTNQAIASAKNSALSSYNTAYHLMRQTLNSLAIGSIESDDSTFAYANLQTLSDRQLRETDEKFYEARNLFLGLKTEINLNTAANDLDKLYNVLIEIKNLCDKTAIALNNATSNMAADKAIVSGMQIELGQNLSVVLGAKSGIENAISSNDLMLSQSQNGLDLAKIDLDNATISLESAKQSADLELLAAQSRLDAAVYSFNNLNYPSPFSGTILAHHIGEGEQASVGQALVEVGNLEIVEVKVEVDSDFASRLIVGDQVVIDGTVNGFVSEIEPVGSLTSGKASITVQSFDNSLKAGKIVEVEFTLTNFLNAAIIVPIRAVTIQSSGNYVLVDVDGVAVKKIVETGEAYGDKIVIVTGLDEGDKVIIPNGVFVSEGDNIKF